ncbi:Protein patched-like protein 3 [Diplonema papillatum]|nr:Protein patched-like protein 3 [Diplonema papillatum]KAJ9465791.1 Protein patched-like protein 3 [Diplonema papillatum]
MRREYLEELYGIDGGIIDFSPTATPLTEALFNCSSLPASQCGFQFGHPFCMFHAASGTCAYVDSVGLAPSYLHKAAVTVEYKGVQWGMREMCTEAPLPPRVASNQTTVLTEVRGPCEAHFTPMDCFSEFPRSHPPLDLVLLKWPQNHQHSVADETSYGQALAEPCRFWSGGFNPKGNTLGGMRYNASSGEVVHVSAYQMLYGIAEKHGFVNKYARIMSHATSGMVFRQLGYPESITVDDAEEILDRFEDALKLHFDRLASDRYEIRVLSPKIVSDVLRDVATENVAYVAIGLSLLLCVVWAFLLRCSRVASRFTLGLGGVVSIGLAVGASLGFSALCGIDFNPLSLQVLPYVGMGLGIDDMFVILHYFSEDPTLPICYRMQRCFGHGGPSVCATTLINAVIFFVGAATVPVKAVTDFALQTGIATLFNFTAVIFAFGGMLVVDARRIKNQRFDVLCCLKDASPMKEHRPSAGRAIAEALTRPLVQSRVLQAVLLLATAAAVGVSAFAIADQLELGLPVEEFFKSGDATERFIKIGNEFFDTSTNRIVGGAGAWHTRASQERLNRLVYDLMNRENSFGVPGRLRLADPTFMISSVAWTQSFRKYALMYPGGQDPENGCACIPDPDGWNDPLVMNRVPAECTVHPDNYYELLALFLGHQTCMEGTAGMDLATDLNLTDPKFYPAACGEPRRTFNTPFPSCREVESAIYRDKVGASGLLPPFFDPNFVFGYGVTSASGNSINIDRATNRINGFTIPLISRGVTQTRIETMLDMMEETRALVDASGLNAYAYGGSYANAEQYRHSKKNMAYLLVCSVLAATLLVSVLMVSPTLGVIQGVCLGSSVVIAVGLLIAIDLKLNGISLLSVAFGIGLNVEVGVHVGRCFLVTPCTVPSLSKREQRMERVVIALGEMAVPVLNGAITSFLGVVVLGFSDVDFFRRYFFAFFSLMIAVALWHAFGVLPVLLSLFGPDPLLAHVVGDGDGAVDHMSSPGRPHKKTVVQFDEQSVDTNLVSVAPAGSATPVANPLLALTPAHRGAIPASAVEHDNLQCDVPISTVVQTQPTIDEP